MLVKNRIILIIVIIMTCFFLFILRLAYIQLIATNHFSKHDINLVEESIKQRTNKFVLHSGRGYFTDRNGAPINIDYYPGLILFPFIKDFHWQVEQVAEILNVNNSELVEAVLDAKEPFVYKVNGSPYKLDDQQMKKINALKIPGVFAQYVQERSENIAPYLIGVTGENATQVKIRYPEQVANGTLSIHSEIGVSGMQRSFDPFLISTGQAALAFFVDNLNQPLFGFDVKYTAPANPYHPTEVVTTIEKDIQLAVKHTLTEVGITKGGAVLLDVNTNDLLSFVNFPHFSLQFPFEEGMKNHLVTTQTPGSIFKIVVAAAAIDTNFSSALANYDCNRNVYGENSTTNNMGTLTFQESFAQSCNYTFSYIANELVKLDANILTKYAKKLGLLEKVGWSGDIFRLEEVRHFPEEELGMIIKDKKDISDYKSLAQTAIGQKNVRITPLAVANMLATIARGGEKLQIRGASRIKYENGTTVVDFPEQQLSSNDEKISPYTAMRLQQLLRLVVKSEGGTAHKLLHDSPYSIAGKTGTAETGLNNDGLNHWFAGYFPADNPKYVMVIIDLDHQKHRLKTLEAYRKIVEYLYIKDMEG